MVNASWLPTLWRPLYWSFQSLERVLTAIYSPASGLLNFYQRYPEAYDNDGVRYTGDVLMGASPIIAIGLYIHVLCSRNDHEKLSRSMRREYRFHQTLMGLYTINSLSFSMADILYGIFPSSNRYELTYLVPSAAVASIITAAYTLLDKNLYNSTKSSHQDFTAKLRHWVDRWPRLIKWLPALTAGLVVGSTGIAALEIDDAIYNNERSISLESQLTCGLILFFLATLIKAGIIANNERLDRYLAQDTRLNSLLRSFFDQEELTAGKIFHHITQLFQSCVMCTYGLLATDGTLHGNRNTNEWTPPPAHIGGLSTLAVITSVFGLRKLPISPRSTEVGSEASPLAPQPKKNSKFCFFGRKPASSPTLPETAYQV